MMENLFVDEKLGDVQEKVIICLYMGDDVNLVEDDARVEDVEGRVVEDACEHDVFEELETIGMVNFSLDVLIIDVYGLVISGRLVKKLSVVGLVGRELGVVCAEVSTIMLANKARRTFKHSNNVEKQLVFEDEFVNGMII